MYTFDLPVYRESWPYLCCGFEEQFPIQSYMFWSFDGTSHLHHGVHTSSSIREPVRCSRTQNLVNVSQLWFNPVRLLGYWIPRNWNELESHSPLWQRKWLLGCTATMEHLKLFADRQSPYCLTPTALWHICMWHWPIETVIIHISRICCHKYERRLALKGLRVKKQKRALCHCLRVIGHSRYNNPWSPGVEKNISFLRTM